MNAVEVPDLGAVRDCMASGWAIDEIADELEAPPDAVCRAVRLLELTSTDSHTVPLPDVVRDCREGGLTWGEIAELLDLTPDDARALMCRRQRGKSGRPYLPIDAAVIRSRHAAGESVAGIARSLGVSDNTIRNRLRGER